MGKLNIRLLGPLYSLKHSCETHRGLGAFEMSADCMAPWFSEQSIDDGLLALAQLEGLMPEIAKHRGEVWSASDDFNTSWKTSEKCLHFLESWHREAVRAVSTVSGHKLTNAAWLTHIVVTLAQTIRAEHAFDGLPILADALEEAGCNSTEVLDHCRAGGSHWSVGETSDPEIQKRLWSEQTGMSPATWYRRAAEAREQHAHS